VVATSGATPQTRALLTVWKISPECAAQQAKYKQRKRKRS
jgi:hypothetical protein